MWSSRPLNHPAALLWSSAESRKPHPIPRASHPIRSRVRELLAAAPSTSLPFCQSGTVARLPVSEARIWIAKNPWRLNDGARRPLKRRPRQPAHDDGVLRAGFFIRIYSAVLHKMRQVILSGLHKRLTLAHVGSWVKAGQPIYQVESLLYLQAGRLAVEQVHSGAMTRWTRRSGSCFGSIVTSSVFHATGVYLPANRNGAQK